MGAYKQYKGKYVYIILHHKEDFPMYIGITNNFVRRYGEHMRAGYGTKFADTISKYLRKTRYRMMVYDFSKFQEISRADLRILESYITSNFSAELSKPEKLSKKKQERLTEILRIVGDLGAEFYEEIKEGKLKKVGTLNNIGCIG